jgi:hypothetical protein
MIKLLRPEIGESFIFCHLKLDGHQVLLEPQHAFTKNFIDLRAALEFLSLPQVPQGFTVLGELWCPGLRASAVKTLIKEQDKRLRFTAWAVEGLAPSMHLADVEHWCKGHGFAFAKWWYSTPSEIPPDGEGWVFKNGNQLDVTKWKPVRTIDAVVTGLVPGKGQHAGKVGALTVSIEGREIASVGGMTLVERDSMSDHCVGQVVEVAYQYVGSKGRLRHPRFIRFRDDKNPDQCLLSQDEELMS